MVSYPGISPNAALQADKRIQERTLGGIDVQRKFGKPEEIRDVTERHRDILIALEATVKVPMEKFMEPYVTVLDRAGISNQTLLHRIVEDNDPFAPNRERKRILLEWLATYHSALLIEQDDNGKTALLVAAKKTPDYFMSILRLGSSSDCSTNLKEVLQEALTKPCFKSRENCLHEAMSTEGYDIDALKTLVELAGPESLKSKDHDNRTPLHFAILREQPSRSVVQFLIQLCPSAMYCKDRDLMTPYQHLCELIRTSERPQVGSLQGIADIFKYRCIRDNLDNDRRTIQQYLYEDTCNEMKFEFDLSYEDDVIDNGYLAGLKKRMNLSFETILAYVKLPKVPLETQNLKQAIAKRAVKEKGNLPGTGLSVYGDVFHWLYQNGVRQIIEVTVDDLIATPHSDEIIETLSRFNIEILNWQKLDLCSETIVKAAPSVEELFLYSSGNNAVLRSWSCKHGLRELKKLKIIHVTVYMDQSLECQSRVDEYLQSFKNRLRSQLPEVDLRTRILENNLLRGFPPTSAIDGYPASTQDHPWLRHMKGFVDECITNWNLQTVDLDAPKIEPDVRVALIDDGVDSRRNDIEVVKGVSFCQMGTRDLRDFFVAPGVHGTRMACLIRELCPRVKLYVARLHEYTPYSREATFDAASAVEAVRWAIEQKVHIISMSWTIKRAQYNIKALEELEKVIREAHSENIIMFSSLSDDRPLPSNEQPPSCYSEVISIGAAAVTGEEFQHIGHGEARFLFPGVDVMFPEYNPSTSSSPQRETGSSVATALAASFAALILFCVEVTYPHLREKFQGQNGMVKAIDAMCLGRGSYALVWEFFNNFDSKGDSNAARISDQEQRLQSIREFVDMLRKAVEMPNYQ